MSLIAATTLSTQAQNRVIFARDFSPNEGIVAAPEKPFRQELCLNGRWQFQPVPLPADYVRNTGTPPEIAKPDEARWETTPLKLPSPWNVNTWGNGRNVGQGTARPYTADSVYYPSYPAAWDGVEMGWLRRSFRVPADWKNQRFILHFEGVAGQAQVFVNGQSAGTHFDSFLPFDLDITALVRRDGDNELLVGIRKSDLLDKISPDFPENQRRTYPNGSNMDSLVGIWNDVSLLALPAVRVDDVFIKPWVNRNLLEAEVTLRNDTANVQNVQINGDVQPWVNLAGKDVLSAPEAKWKLDLTVLRLASQTVTIPPQSTARVTLSQKVGNQLRFWTPATPNLYGLVLKINQGGATLDSHYSRFGWRQFTIQGRDLLLNGAKIQLVGDLLHPFGPFIGSRRYTWAFYKMIKDVGGNAVRPHAQPRPRHYLDLADEMGLCVLDEAAIFGSSISLNLKEPETWQRLRNHVDGLVQRDRNHPSVFGWSTGNEMFALFFKTSQADREIQFRKLQELALRPRNLDQTRPWISVDGDQDLEGVLPTWSKHMGIGVPKDLPDIEKPLMIGEHGGTYYADPPLLAPLIGERAYESYATRNEALAIDLYRTIQQAARPRLAYFSPSELAWFGVEQLPFGYRTTERVPNLTDGVFFDAYIEGKPGVQIERLPPYCMTFNPGFDPALPLYKPLPMFDAMKAALDPRGPQPSQWAELPHIESRSHPSVTNSIPRVAFLGNRAGTLFQSLYLMGVPLADENDALFLLLVVDGENLGVDTAKAKETISSVLRRGGLAWIIARDKGAALAQLNGILPQGVEITPRRASSLLRGTEDAAIRGFGLGQLYFVDEPGDPYIQKAGLGGSFLKSSRVLLTASNTEWTLFHERGEVEKNSNVLIYERLQKPSGAALVEVPQATGKLWISTLDYQSKTPTVRAFWRQLFQNIGVKLDKPPVMALVASGKDGEGALWHYTIETPAADWMQPNFNDGAWQTGRGGFGGRVPNGEPKTDWHTADIWLRHEFILKKLPQQLMLQVHHDEDVEIYLNGTQIFTERGHITDYKNVEFSAEWLKLLQTGRNVLAVHCHQTAGGQFVDVGLVQESTTPNAPKKEHDLLLQGPKD